MMKCLNHAVISAAMIAVLSVACLADDVPILKPSDLPSGTIVKTEYYSGKALFGYMDGGAELYLEYNFQKLSRQELRIANETLIAEIYQMEGAYEAYGIFSIQRFKCVPVDTSSPNTCQSRYQLQAVVGNCYLSIVSESGSPAAQKASVTVYRAINAKIKPLEVPIPEILRSPALARYRGRMEIICGSLGIQNGLNEWEPLFQGIPKFFLTLIPIEQGSKQLTLAHIRFLSKQDQAAFCWLAGFEERTGSIQERDIDAKRRVLKRLTEDEVLFIESSISFPDKDLIRKLLLD